MEDLRIEGLKEWRIGGMKDWRIGGIEDWRNEGLKELRIGVSIVNRKSYNRQSKIVNPKIAQSQ